MENHWKIRSYREPDSYCVYSTKSENKINMTLRDMTKDEAQAIANTLNSLEIVNDMRKERKGDVLW